MEQSGNKYAQRFIGACRGLHELALSKTDGREEVIDIDMAPRGEVPVFATYTAAQEALIDLTLELPEEEPNRDMIARKLSALGVVARVLSGEEMAFEDLAQVTMNVTPVPVSESTLADNVAIMERWLAAKDLRFDPYCVKQYEKHFVLHDQLEIQRQAHRHFMLSKHMASRYVVLPEEMPKPEFVNMPQESWTGFYSTDATGRPRGFINRSANHKQTIGKIATTVAHEFMGHAVQFGLLREGIARGDVSPAMGITTMYTPECFQTEVVAQNAEHMMTIDETEVLYQRIYNEYARMVYHNMSCKIGAQEPVSSVAQYGIDRLPFEPKGRVRNLATLLRERPLMAANFTCYVPAREVGRPIEQLSFVRAKRVLGHLYSKVLTREEVEEAIIWA